MKTFNHPAGAKPEKESHPNWRGGIFKDQHNGYLFERDVSHPNAIKGGYVLQHRLVVERYLERYLEPDEIVHHLDGSRDNNVIDNLDICISSKHSSFHNKTNPVWAGKHLSAETREKISNAHKGKVVTEKTKKKISEIKMLPSLKECGHLNWRKCRYCKEYDDPDNMHIHLKSRSAYHRACKNTYERIRQSKQKEITI